MTEALTSELAGYQARFRENRVLADRLVAGLTSAQFNWRPADNRWSAAECFDHLNISARLFAEQIDRAIADGRRRGLVGTGRSRYGLIARLVLRALDPATRRRFKTPAMFMPAPGSAYELRPVLAGFHDAGERWEQLLRDANGLDLGRIKTASPARPLIRIPLGAMFAIEAAHEQRHLRQAEDVLALQRAGSSIG